MHMEDTPFQPLTIGKPAPEFTCGAYLPETDDVNGKVSLSDSKGKWTLLFFYPLDFTFVCPTEIIHLAEMSEEFEKKQLPNYRRFN